MRWRTLGAIAGTTVVLGFGATVIVDEVRIAALPDNEKLVVPKERVFASEIVAGHVEYQYQTSLIEKLHDEVANKRTPYSRTFQRGAEIQIVFDAINPY